MIAVAPLVLVYQSAALALAQIRTNKLRALLTTLGILIGVAAVSAVIALIDGMHRRVVAEFESFGANKLFISPRWRESDIHRRDAWTNVVFKNDLFDDVLDRCPSVESFTRDAGYGPVPVAFGSRSTNDMDRSHFHSVDPDWHSIMRRGAEQGRPMTPIDSDRVAAVCLINEAMRDFLALDRDPSGAIVNVEYFGRMRVLGMIEPVHGLVGSPDMGEIVVPFTFSTQRFHWPTWYTVFASAKSRDVVEEAKAELDFYMRQKRRLRPGEEANFHIATSKRTLEELDDVARMMTVTAVGIVAISLLVGGVGIMNIMLVSVSERTREIGLRKAVGARPGTILLQFLVEAVVLCLVGGAIGLALGQGLTSAVAATLPSPQAMIQYDPLDNNEQEKRSGDGGGGQIWLPPAAVAVAFSFSAGVGLVFGMFPAIKAARLDPIDALRHE